MKIFKLIGRPILQFAGGSSFSLAMVMCVYHYTDFFDFLLQDRFLRFMLWIVRYGIPLASLLGIVIVEKFAFRSLGANLPSIVSGLIVGILGMFFLTWLVDALCLELTILPVDDPDLQFLFLCSFVGTAFCLLGFNVGKLLRLKR
jgi:hypothetical protein